MTNTIKMNDKTKIIIALVLFFFFFFGVDTTHAQETICPPGTALGNGTVLHNSYPSTLRTCWSVLAGGFGAGHVDNASDDFGIVGENIYLPCYDRVHIPNPIDFASELDYASLRDSDMAVYFAISPLEYMETDVRIRFRFSMLSYGGYVAPPPPLVGTWYLTYYSDDLSFSQQISGELSDLYRTGIWWEFKYRNLYLIDETIDLISSQSGGFVSFSIVNNRGEPLDYGVSVFHPHIRSSHYNFPFMCANHNTYPISSTPTPSPTLEPTTTGTPYPTTEYKTPVPIVTTTPIPYVTLPPRVDPTQHPVPTVQPLVFPTISFPTVEVFTNTITATVTSTPQPTSTPAPTANAMGTAEAIATEWYQPIENVTSRFEVSATVGISNTADNIRVAMAGMAWPIRFAKAIRFYSPATWPMYAMVFAVFGLIIFTTVYKFLFGIASMVISILRKLWEAIPFN